MYFFIPARRLNEEPWLMYHDQHSFYQQHILYWLGGVAYFTKQNVLNLTTYREAIFIYAKQYVKCHLKTTGNQKSSNWLFVIPSCLDIMMSYFMSWSMVFVCHAVIMSRCHDMLSYVKYWSYRDMGKPNSQL